MPTQIENFNQANLKTGLPDIRPGDTVSVYQKIPSAVPLSETAAGKKEGERIQIFSGLVIARKHGKGSSATITVRKTVSGVGVEKIFPLSSPVIEKIEVLKKGKVRRAKLYYLRTAKGKRARLKKEFAEVLPQETAEEPKPQPAENA